MAPKAAGLAFTLATMGDQFDGLIDITLNYPDNPRHPFKDFLMRHLDLIQVRTTEHVIDESLIGDYFHNKESKRRFQQRLNRRWAEKDEILARWQADEAQAPRAMRSTGDSPRPQTRARAKAASCSSEKTRMPWRRSRAVVLPSPGTETPSKWPL